MGSCFGIVVVSLKCHYVIFFLESGVGWSRLCSSNSLWSCRLGLSVCGLAGKILLEIFFPQLTDKGGEECDVERLFKWVVKVLN